MPRKILPPLDWQIGEDEPKAEGLKKKFFSFIGKGMLPEGTRLPSVRQMAASSGVSKNTVERVYAELKDEGVIAVRPGSGFWVAERPPVICPPEIGAIAAEDSHVKMPITSAAKEAADALFQASHQLASFLPLFRDGYIPGKALGGDQCPDSEISLALYQLFGSQRLLPASGNDLPEPLQVPFYFGEA